MTKCNSQRLAGQRSHVYVFPCLLSLGLQVSGDTLWEKKLSFVIMFMFSHSLWGFSGFADIVDTWQPSEVSLGDVPHKETHVYMNQEKNNGWLHNMLCNIVPLSASRGIYHKSPEK